MVLEEQVPASANALEIYNEAFNKRFLISTHCDEHLYVPD